MKAVFTLARVSTIMPAPATCDSHYCTCFGHLGQPDTNRNYPISVAPPKVAKASTVVTVTCQCHGRYRFTNFASVNEQNKITKRSFWWTNTLAYLSLLSATKKERFCNIERWHQFKCHHNFQSYCDFFENGSPFLVEKHCMQIHFPNVLFGWHDKKCVTWPKVNGPTWTFWSRREK